MGKNYRVYRVEVLGPDVKESVHSSLALELEVRIHKQ